MKLYMAIQQRIVFYTVILCLVIATFFVSIGGVNAASIIGTPTNFTGMVGYWTFDGPDMASNVADKSGQGNHGALILGSTGYLATTTFPGKVGQALDLDGQSDTVRLSSSVVSGSTLDLTGKSWTMSAWVRWNKTFSRSIIMSSDSSNHDTGIITSNSANRGRFRLTIDGGTLAGADITCTNVDPVSGRWYFVTATWDGANARLYVDGVLCTTSGATGTDYDSVGDQFYIGSDRTGTNTYWNAPVDEVRLYSRALSDGEIAALYRNGENRIGSSQNTKLTNGLVGLWSFDGPDMLQNVADRSGQDNNGNLSGFTSTTTAPGKIGQALKFDGVDDSINIGSPVSLDDLSTLTYSVWIKPATIGVNRPFFAKSDNSSSGHGWDFGFDQGTASRLVFNHRGFNSTDLSVRSGSNTIVPNVWQHFVVTWDGSSLASGVHIYKDGVETGYALHQNGGGVIQSDASNAATIGHATGYGSTNRFDGMMDDARVYNRVLSASEIQQLYNLGTGGKQSSSQNTKVANGLIGLWSFDGPDMLQNVADRSGQGHNGRLVGFTSTTTVPGKIGQALKFDGANDYVSLGASTDFTFTNASAISLWAKTGNSGLQRLINFERAAASTAQGIEMSSNAAGADTSDGKPGGRYRNISGPTALAKSSIAINDNKWHHIAWIIDGSNGILYVDGVSAASVNDVDTTGTFGHSSDIAAISSIAGSTGFFNGSLDDVRVYNRSLSAAEVQNLYRIGR